MFGHRWETAEATIVDSRVTKTTGDGMVSIHEYVAEVRPSDAPAFRTVLKEPALAMDFWPPAVGDTVTVRADVRRGEAKFDKDDPRISAKHRKQAAQSAGRDRFAQALAQEPEQGR